MENIKNCAFQYAKISTGFLGGTEIVEDVSAISLEDAKELWNKYYPDLRKFIKSGNRGEMVIWINMKDDSDYNEKLYHIGGDAEVDGQYIIEKTVNYFKPTL